MNHFSFMPKKSPIRARAVLAAGAALGLSAVMTFALFTDDGYVESTFSTGTLDMSFDATQQGPATAPHTTTLGISNGKIGSTTIAPLTVNNDGSLPFTYAMSTTSSNGTASATLIAGLKVSIATVAAAGDCSAASFTTPIYSGLGLNAASLSGRAVAANSSEVLCFKVELPTGANDNAMKGLTTKATFAFLATQS